MTFTITIYRDDILRRVKMTTAYLAVNHHDAPASFDRIAAASADDDILRHYWQDACEESNACLRSWIHTAATLPSVDADRYEVVLRMRPPEVSLRQESVSSMLQAMMVASILSRWTSITCPEAENRFVAETQDWRARLARLLSFKPHRRRGVW